MRRPGRTAVPRERERRFWELLRSGVSVEVAAGLAGVSMTSARRWCRSVGGVIPVLTAPCGYRLSPAEREEIACLTAAGHGVREVGRRIGRPASTVSRELARNTTSAQRGYRARTAQAQAEKNARRPKVRKLAVSLPLRAQVQARLEQNHSPQQIAARLRDEFPNDLEMRVSHETIYQALYVQGRGGLRQELVKHLRTGRSVRQPRRVEGERRTRIPGMVNIADRPPEVEDRAVPGHWAT